LRHATDRAGDGYEGETIRDLPRRAMSTDAIVLLKEDHKEIRKVFTDF
jgi:hypothetical protein